MGYTHYWYKTQKLDTIQFHDFLADFSKVIEENHGLGQLVEFQNSTDYLNFNGIGEQAHETFFFERKVDMDEFIQKNKDNRIFSFCKTARKPYDVLVCIALIIAKKQFTTNVDISSDGCDESDMWQEPRQICQNTLGYGQKFDFKKNGQAVFRRKRVEEMTIDI